MTTRDIEDEAALLRQAHAAIRDLLKPRMSHYWLDFAASYTVAGVLFAAAAAVGLEHPLSWPMVLGSGVALYRCAVFIHEIVHFLGRRAFARFRLVWNAMIGIPLLIPLFMYECHAEHHNRRHYGTVRDAEYVPLARLSRWRIVGIVAAIPMLPLYGVLRFGVLAPLVWLVPGTRERVWRRSSALKLDVEYVGRPPAPGEQERSWRRQEAAATLVVLAAVAVGVSGLVPVAIYVQMYATMGVVVLSNTFRLLGAHRYLGDEDEMSTLEQVADTINYARRPWLGELWAPVGLRLHALHHLMPGLPYHAYPAAHRRLLAALPPDSVYHRAASPGLWYSLRRLWRTSGRRAELDGLSVRSALDLVTQTTGRRG